jgi:3',5'-cyclic-nucleotide phosphodiesterase
MSIGIKMADISNCCRPSHLYAEWGQKIAAEFYNQGDTEARLNYSVSPFMDRRKDATDFAKGQISFMNYIVIPLFEVCGQLLPKMNFAVDEAKRNRLDLINRQQQS